MPEPLRKPAWLPAEDWRQLLALHGGAPRCSVCATTDNLSVDHLVPRHYGGLSDLSNLDFKCIRHNSLKGISDDRYWSRPLTWDEVPDLNKFRAAQRDVYLRLTEDREVSAWFGRFSGDITRYLYLLAWVVGAGKTLAIPAVALAYNQVQIRRWGRASRRADHILVVTREQNIRDQLAKSLAEDVSDYGILSTPLRVYVLKKYDDLFSGDRWLDNYDVVVACTQMFWGENREPKPRIIEALGKFCLIFIDEPHFAHGQVQELLKQAPRSVVFGLTGSPIKRNTSLLKDYVLLSSYTYQDADRYDRSLKHIDVTRSLHPVKMDSADILRAGEERKVISADDPDYDGTSLITAQQVASYVIRLMQELDLELAGRPAPHRDAAANADLLYPAHAMISVPSRVMAEMLRKQINAHFKANKRSFPAAAGWACNSIFLGDGDEGGGEHLDPDRHPWMRTYRNGNARLQRWQDKGLAVDPGAIYRCDEMSARILIVVGMAREGVSNPLCTITASVGDESSIIEAVQRWVGRAARTVMYVDSDGERHFPPDRLDTVHFAYHETSSKTQQAARDGIAWILNMGDYLAGLPAIGDLINEKTIPVMPDPGTIDDPLTAAKKVSMAVQAVEICGEDWRDDDEAVDQIVGALCMTHAPDNTDKAGRIREWIAETLRTSPDEAFRATGHLPSEELPSLSVVMAEREKHDPTVEELADWARRWMPEVVAYLPTMAQNPGMYHSVLSAYRKWADQGIMAQVQPDVNLEVIRKAFTTEVMDFLKGYLTDRHAASGVAKNSVNIAFRIVLQVPEDETCGKGTRWDCPQVHTLLLRPDIRRAILGWTRARLIKKGYCPTIARAFGLTPDE